MNNQSSRDYILPSCGYILSSRDYILPSCGYILSSRSAAKESASAFVWLVILPLSEAEGEEFQPPAPPLNAGVHPRTALSR
jgi:hypothetical protein